MLDATQQAGDVDTTAVAVGNHRHVPNPAAADAAAARDRNAGCAFAECHGIADLPRPGLVSSLGRPPRYLNDAYVPVPDAARGLSSGAQGPR